MEQEHSANKSLLQAQIVLNAVLDKGAVLLYNKYLQPKIKPHCVRLAVDSALKPPSVSSFLFHFQMNALMH
jgi:hypothetical protein